MEGILAPRHLGCHTERFRTLTYSGLAAYEENLHCLFNDRPGHGVTVLYMMLL